MHFCIIIIIIIKHLLNEYKYEKTYSKEKSQGFKDRQTIKSNYISRERKREINIKTI